MNVFRTKPIKDILSETTSEHQLKKVLGAKDLVSLGIGAIIGTGIFVITGQAAVEHAGPAVIISFLLAAITCTFAALTYAEFASMIPIAGSAYTYSYASLGELVAWIIGWDLILEYSVAISTVAIGWSGYFTNLLKTVGIHLPLWMTSSMLSGKGGLVDIPAFLITLVIAGLLIIGIKESAVVNNIIVVVKIFIILLFIVLALPHVNAANYQPFMPFGVKGILSGSAIVFFAFIGFDAVSTAAEEVKNPQRDLPKGITISLLAAAILYVAVCAVLTGIVRYTDYANQSAPVAYGLLRIGKNWASGLVSLGAVAAMTSVLLVMMLGQTRIFFAMSRDGLLPKLFKHVSKRTNTPVKSTILTFMITSVPAACLPIQVVVELANIGTLAAFIMVSAGIIVLRYKKPDEPRPFKCPAVPYIPALVVILCASLMFSLHLQTWIRFLAWMLLGLAIYFLYSVKRSNLNFFKR